MASNLFVPTARQAEFLSCPCFEVLYGGAKGGGKTEAMLYMPMAQLTAAAEQYAKKGRRSLGWAVFFRRSMPQLQEVIARSHLIYPAIDPGAKYKSDEHVWTFSCGYRIQFAQLEDPNAHIDWNGKQITLLMIDQVEEIPYETYYFLKIQVRTADPALEPLLGIRLSANPLGRHVQWVKERFIGPYKDGGHVWEERTKLKSGKEQVRTRVFIKALLYDNPHVNESYEAELLNAPEHIRRAFLDGDWDVSVGSFFGDAWDPRVHVVDLPREQVSPHWEKFRCGDWGVRDAACCLWIAVDVDGNLIVFDELYGPGSTGRDWAKAIIKKEKEWGLTEKDKSGQHKSILSGPLDWAANSSTGFEGPTPIEQMLEEGVLWYPADKRRNEGWAELRARLLTMGGPSGRTPGIRIAKRCTNLIRTLPNLIADKNDPDDVAQKPKQEDHACDALRYGVMSRPQQAKEKPLWELDQWERIMLKHAEDRAALAEDDRNEFTGY